MSRYRQNLTPDQVSRKGISGLDVITCIATGLIILAVFMSWNR